MSKSQRTAVVKKGIGPDDCKFLKQVFYLALPFPNNILN
tara:strand:+ start:1329 stop:1445 length:117 start_codon:yes stop_codon:yes gene_type:complete